MKFLLSMSDLGSRPVESAVTERLSCCGVPTERGPSAKLWLVGLAWIEEPEVLSEVLPCLCPLGRDRDLAPPWLLELLFGETEDEPWLPATEFAPPWPEPVCETAEDGDMWCEGFC